ncbi:MAG: TetR/AcrR family transcriptional regulator [Acidimicrobiales bacterium]
MPSTAVATPLRRTQLERRTDAEQGLLNAAVQLFASKGIDQTSLAEIGEAAGYSRGLVNHHFGSKAALVERLAERSQRRFIYGLSSLDEPDAVDALVAIADAYLRTVEEAADDARAFFVMWGAALPDDATLRSVFVTDDRRFRGAVEQLVVTGRARGTVRREVDPVGFAVAFVGLLRGASAQFLVDREGVDLGATTVACESFVRAALSPSWRRDR